MTALEKNFYLSHSFYDRCFCMGTAVDAFIRYTYGTWGVVREPCPVLESGDGFAAWPIFARYPTFQAYAELLFDTPQFFNVFWNSCKQVFPIILGHIVLGAPAAWAFARFDFRGKKVLYTLYIVLMLMPFQVTMVSSYLVLNKLGLIDTAWAIILPGVASTLPVFIMTRFLWTIPGAVTEAAAVDGASPIQTFLRLGLPLGAPGILSAVVLGFLEYWNAMEAPQAFLKDPDTLAAVSVYGEYHRG